MIAAQLSDDYFIVGVGTEQSQRKAYIIIEILWGLDGTKPLTQDMIGNLPCCRLAD
jgi:hypothetical protein